MRKFIVSLFLGLLILIPKLQGQLLSVTATLTDTDGQTWNNGTCIITPYNSTGGPNYYNGVAIPVNPSCTINSSGVLSASLYNTGTLNPNSAQYQFTIQSNTSAKASTFLSPVTSSNLSSTLSALITAPRFSASSTAFGYLDVEALAGQVGLTYYNVSTPAWRQCTVVTNTICTTWVTVGSGGGGGSPGGVTGSPQQNVGGSFAAVGQVFYNQTGDTISSIETECSSPCTYVVTVPQVITLTASHTLSANVNLQFLNGGEWTVNGSWILTIPGNVQGVLSQHFAGSATVKFGQLQAEVPVEWFGAVDSYRYLLSWHGQHGGDPKRDQLAYEWSDRVSGKLLPHDWGAQLDRE